MFRVLLSLFVSFFVHFQKLIRPSWPTVPSPHPYGQPDYKITIFFGWQFSLLIFSKLDALLNIKPWQEGLGTATSSRRGANDTAEDIAILDVGTCTAEILGAIIAYIQLSISIERQNNLFIMTYLDLSHVRLGLHICCDSNSDWHQRLGLVSFHDMRRRPWFFLSGLGPQERHLLMGLTPSSEKRICTSNFRCIEQSQNRSEPMLEKIGRKARILTIAGKPILKQNSCSKSTAWSVKERYWLFSSNQTLSYSLDFPEDFLAVTIWRKVNWCGRQVFTHPISH